MFGSAGFGRYPVFTKILLGFLLVILPLYVLSVQIYVSGQNKIQKELAETSKEKVNFYLSTLENHFEKIMHLQLKLFGDPDLRLLAFNKVDERDYETGMAINHLQDYLLGILDTSSFVLDASIFIPSMDIKISHNRVTDISKEEFGSMIRLMDQNFMSVRRWKDGVYINVAYDDYADTANSQTSICYIISVKLSEQKIQVMLDNFSTKPHGKAILISQGQGLQVLHGLDKEDDPYFRSFLAKQQPGQKKVSVKQLTAKKGKYIVTVAWSEVLHSYLLVYEPEQQILQVLAGYKAWVWIISLFTIGTIILFSFWIKSMVTGPLDRLVKAFRKVDEGELNISVKYGKGDEFGFLYQQFNEMFNKLDTLINQVCEQKILVKNAELKQLQYQINPHFLYNSMLVVQGLIKSNDEEGAVKLVQHLAEYYRYITKNSSETVMLYKEVNHTSAYIEVQKIRFPKRLRVEMDEIPEGCHFLPVPLLILQPVVENTFNHGLKNKAEDAFLRIRMVKEAAFLRIFIEDNGKSLTDEGLSDLKSRLVSAEKAEDISGLMNVNRRIQIKYGKESGVFLSRSLYGGLCVELRIGLGTEAAEVESSAS